MWFKKNKRKFYKKIPPLFLSLVLISALIFVIFNLSKIVLSKQTLFVSPLARGQALKEGSLAELLHKNNIQFSRIETVNDSSSSSNIIFLRDQGVLYLDRKKNWQSQISSLQLILSRLTIEGKKFKKLDLRFEKPIIEF